VSCDASQPPCAWGPPPPQPGPLRSPLRFAAAACAATAALVHTLVMEDHFESARYLGVLFALYALVCAGVALLLARRDTRVVWQIAAGSSLLAIAAYAWSRAVGLPQIDDDVGNWAEPLGIVALTAEGTLVALALGALRHWRAEGRLRGHSPVLAGTLALALGLSGTALAAGAPGGEHPARSAAMAGMPGMTADAQGADAHWAATQGAPFHSDGVTRTYYISADPVVWNYAPDGRNDTTGKPFDEVADTYVRSGPGRIGSSYLKCLYRGYTDASFTRLQPHPADEQYLGILGPVIRAEVGDTIKVVFRNTCPFPASVHPHGVFYEKDSEGAPYDDGTSGPDKSDDAVPTGGRHTYVWEVPERAGPGPGDGSSVMWMYHSHTDEVADTYAGLMGPMEITAQGMARPDGGPKDVDREFFELFSVMNENNSPFLHENLRRFAQAPYPNPDDEEFQESNLMHSINGYVFGNQPLVTMRRGERVRWYVMSMGTEVDLHTPHWHGNTVLVSGMRMDTVGLLPASMVVADMVPDDPGTWLFHCHVNDHLIAGMITRYRVLP